MHVKVYGNLKDKTQITSILQQGHRDEFLREGALR